MRFRLVEYFEEPPIDYHTGDIAETSPKGIFDNRTHVPYYDDLMKDPGKFSVKVEQMSPNEYFEWCAFSIFNKPVEVIKRGRVADTKAIEYLKKLITKYKRKMFLPYINFAEHTQEGLHRMYAAGEVFGWDTKFPVLTVRRYVETDDYLNDGW